MGQIPGFALTVNHGKCKCYTHLHVSPRILANIRGYTRSRVSESCNIRVFMRSRVSYAIYAATRPSKKAAISRGSTCRRVS